MALSPEKTFVFLKSEPDPDQHRVAVIVQQILEAAKVATRGEKVGKYWGVLVMVDISQDRASVGVLLLKSDAARVRVCPDES